MIKVIDFKLTLGFDGNKRATFDISVPRECRFDDLAKAIHEAVEKQVVGLAKEASSEAGKYTSEIERQRNLIEQKEKQIDDLKSQLLSKNSTKQAKA